MLKNVSLEVQTPYFFFNFNDLVFGRALLTSGITLGAQRGEAGQGTSFCPVHLYWFGILLNLFLDGLSLQKEVRSTTVV
jgi:hypothetical protein